MLIANDMHQTTETDIPAEYELSVDLVLDAVIPRALALLRHAPSSLLPENVTALR